MTSVDLSNGRARSSDAPTVPSLAEALTPTRLSARPVTSTSAVKRVVSTMSTCAAVVVWTSMLGDTCSWYPSALTTSVTLETPLRGGTQ